MLQIFVHIHAGSHVKRLSWAEIWLIQNDGSLNVLSHKVKTLGDHLNNSVVHMRDQRNAKKGLFFEAERARIAIRGQNVPIFKKKGPFGFN